MKTKNSIRSIIATAVASALASFHKGKRSSRGYTCPFCDKEMTDEESSAMDEMGYAICPYCSKKVTAGAAFGYEDDEKGGRAKRDSNNYSLECNNCDFTIPEGSESNGLVSGDDCPECDKGYLTIDGPRLLKNGKPKSKRYSFKGQAACPECGSAMNYFPAEVDMNSGEELLAPTWVCSNKDCNNSLPGEAFDEPLEKKFTVKRSSGGAWICNNLHCGESFDNPSRDPDDDNDAPYCPYCSSPDVELLDEPLVPKTGNSWDAQVEEDALRGGRTKPSQEDVDEVVYKCQACGVAFYEGDLVSVNGEASCPACKSEDVGMQPAGTEVNEEFERSEKPKRHGAHKRWGATGTHWTCPNCGLEGAARQEANIPVLCPDCQTAITSKDLEDETAPQHEWEAMYGNPFEKAQPLENLRTCKYCGTRNGFENKSCTHCGKRNKERKAVKLTCTKCGYSDVSNGTDDWDDLIEGEPCPRCSQQVGQPGTMEADKE